MKLLFKEFLDYFPDSGVFIWKKRPSSRASVGAQAGVIQSGGYRQIKLRGERYYAHRLAWFFVYGIDPEDEIDHINGIRDDNRIANLRTCTRSQNMQNIICAGVYFERRRAHWVAEIVGPDGKVYLGSFKSFEEAGIAYQEAKVRLHEFQRPAS